MTTIFIKLRNRGVSNATEPGMTAAQRYWEKNFRARLCLLPEQQPHYHYRRFFNCRYQQQGNRIQLYRNRPDTDNITGCDVLKGSTLFDDFTYYGRHSDNLYEVEPFGSDAVNSKDPIYTYIVNTGTKRTGLSTVHPECDPYGLLESAAINGGPVSATSTVYDGEDPEKLRSALDELFSSILTRTSSGSAASVISSSRSGEGALYQAIFWPDKDSGKVDSATNLPVYVSWTGEVHAFLVDELGTLYLDSYPGPDGRLCRYLKIVDNDNEKEIYDKPVVVYYDEDLEETKGCIGRIEPNNP